MPKTLRPMSWLQGMRASDFIFSLGYYQPSKVLPCPLSSEDRLRCVHRHVSRGSEPNFGQSPGDLRCHPELTERWLCLSLAPPEGGQSHGIMPYHSPVVFVLAQTNFVSPVRELQGTIQDCISKWIALNVLDVMGALRFWSDPAKCWAWSPSGS